LADTVCLNSIKGMCQSIPTEDALTYGIRSRYR
jgi:hypothetical protein